MKKIYFEDQGQDFLWWVINKDGLVTDCGPFQKQVWTGNTVVDHDHIKVGETIDIILKSPKGMRGLNIREVNYKIEKIESI